MRSVKNVRETNGPRVTRVSSSGARARTSPPLAGARSVLPRECAGRFAFAFAGAPTTIVVRWITRCPGEARDAPTGAARPALRGRPMAKGRALFARLKMCGCLPAGQVGRPTSVGATAMRERNSRGERAKRKRFETPRPCMNPTIHGHFCPEAVSGAEGNERQVGDMRGC